MHVFHMGNPFHNETYLKGKMYKNHAGKVFYKIILISYTEKRFYAVCLS